MKTHLLSSIVFASLAATCLSNLAFIPAAQAQAQPRQKIEQEMKRDREQIEERRKDRDSMNDAINDTRPSNQTWSNAKGGLFEILAIGSIFALTSPSVISAEGGVGYGTQILFPIDKQILFRGGFHFQPNSSTLNAGATYSLLKGSSISPFIGGGWRTKSYGSKYVGVRNDGFYGTAGVDIFMDPLIITVQANQAVKGGSTEFQGTVNFVRLLFGS